MADRTDEAIQRQHRQTQAYNQNESHRNTSHQQLDGSAVSEIPPNIRPPVYIEGEEDALLVLTAAINDIAFMIVKERAEVTSIYSGLVIIIRETELLQRWRGCSEKAGKDDALEDWEESQEACELKIPSYSSSHKIKSRGLVKKSISVDFHGSKYRVVNYFYIKDLIEKKIPRARDLAVLKDIAVPQHAWSKTTAASRQEMRSISTGLLDDREDEKSRSGSITPPSITVAPTELLMSLQPAMAAPSTAAGRRRPINSLYSNVGGTTDTLIDDSAGRRGSASSTRTTGPVPYNQHLHPPTNNPSRIMEESSLFSEQQAKKKAKKRSRSPEKQTEKPKQKSLLKSLSAKARCKYDDLRVSRSASSLMTRSSGLILDDPANESESGVVSGPLLKDEALNLNINRQGLFLAASENLLAARSSPYESNPTVIETGIGSIGSHGTELRESENTIQIHHPFSHNSSFVISGNPSGTIQSGSPPIASDAGNNPGNSFTLRRGPGSRGNLLFDLLPNSSRKYLQDDSSMASSSSHSNLHRGAATGRADDSVTERSISRNQSVLSRQSSDPMWTDLDMYRNQTGFNHPSATNNPVAPMAFGRTAARQGPSRTSPPNMTLGLPGMPTMSAPNSYPGRPTDLVNAESIDDVLQSIRGFDIDGLLKDEPQAGSGRRDADN